MIHYISSAGVGQPWVANELRQVQLAGVPFKLHAMRRPAQVHFDSDWAEQFNRDTSVLYPLPPIGLIVSVLAAPFLFGGRFFAAICNALFSSRETFRGRIAALAHFFVACHWARTIRRQSIDHIHSQWAYSSATIGMYGSWLLGKSFSFTGHGSDLWRDRVALRDKVRRAEFIICISNFHRDIYLKCGAKPEQLIIAYCGIDPTTFKPSLRDRTPGEAYRILASGRLVEKKGFAILIDACKMLIDRGENIECVIGGSGELLDELNAQVRRLGIADRVKITGQAIKQEDIPAFMHAGDLYCLPCVWAKDGDVDGLPQMLMEAMACGLPVISTRLVGIPDLVLDGETGLLVAAENTAALAEAISRMTADPALARRLADAGCAFVLERFDIRTCLEPLINQYRIRLRPGGTAGPAGATDTKTDQTPALGR